MIPSVDKSSGQSPDDDGIFYRHPGNDLTEVMADMCQKHPEESFCFLNEKTLEDRGRFLLENFGRGRFDSNFSVGYAVKANARKRILQILDGVGIKDFDCASPNEIRCVQAVNPNARILYNNPIKRQKDIQDALAMGVNHFTVQSRAELEKILAHSRNKSLETVVRMETPNKDAVINLSTKFGASRARTKKLLDRMKNLPGVTAGISVHTGSQNKNPAIFRDAISQIAKIAQAHDNVQIVNLGGGLPVNYFPNEKYDVAEYIAVINRAINELIGDGYEILMEPGRYVVAEAVDLVIPVTSVESRRGKRCLYFEDGVFTCFSDSPVHRWRYNFKPYSPRGKKFSDERKRISVFGRTCDSGDVIRNVSLPVDIAPGDYLRVAAAGAYMDSQTTYFNGYEPPKYVSYNTLT